MPRMLPSLSLVIYLIYYPFTQALLRDCLSTNYPDYLRKISRIKKLLYL